MQPLISELTQDSPRVILDDKQQIFLIQGESCPEYTSKFYLPIIKWFEEYCLALHRQKQNFGYHPRMTLHFKLNYFNSTSAKFIGDILSLLDSFSRKGCELRVKWFYADIDMKESAEEYMQLYTHLPFKLVLLDAVGNNMIHRE